MNAKKKIAGSILTMISCFLIVVVAISLPISMQNAQKQASAKAYNSYGVAATVSGNYYVGNASFKMYSEENDKIVFDAEAESSSPALDPVESIKLSSSNDYVVFEYKFVNNSSSVSFVTSFTSIIETENMEVAYAYSYEKLNSYEKVNKTTTDNVPLISGQGNTLYLYVKVKVEDLNKNSTMNGTFCFNLTAEEVYEIYLVGDGLIGEKTYAALGYELCDVEVPQRKGYTFEGYFTKPLGLGEQIFDKNGQSTKIWAQDSGDVLYAHYSKEK